MATLELTEFEAEMVLIMMDYAVDIYSTSDSEINQAVLRHMRTTRNKVVNDLKQQGIEERKV